MKKIIFIFFICILVSIPASAYFGGQPFGQTPFGQAQFGAGNFGEGGEEDDTLIGTYQMQFSGTDMQFSGTDMEYTN